MSTFHGGFILRPQGYGILSGTYFNTGELKPYQESAIREAVDENYPADDFAGVFKTIWLQADGTFTGRLTITRDADAIYRVEWRSEKSNKLEYQGHGIIEGGVLVGFYW